MKDNLEKLLLQLQNDFEELMSRVAREKKSSHLLAVEAMSLKRTRDEKLKEIEKLDEVIEDLGKQRKQIGKEKQTGYFIEIVSCVSLIFFLYSDLPFVSVTERN